MFSGSNQLRLPDIGAVVLCVCDPIVAHDLADLLINQPNPIRDIGNGQLVRYFCLSHVAIVRYDYLTGEMADGLVDRPCDPLRRCCPRPEHPQPVPNRGRGLQRDPLGLRRFVDAHSSCHLRGVTNLTALHEAGHRVSR